MQRWKLVAAVSFALSVSSMACKAEGVVPVDPGSVSGEAPGENTEQNAETGPVQQHLIDMMQNDFAFEDQKRSLTNELVLEKLRSEIQKTKETYEHSPPAMVEPQEQTQVDPQGAASPVANIVDLPKVLLVSDIGGVSRVAVSVNDAVKLVRLNEIFVIDGHKFQVSNSGHNMPSVKEIMK